MKRTPEQRLAMSIAAKKRWAAKKKAMKYSDPTPAEYAPVDNFHAIADMNRAMAASLSTEAWEKRTGLTSAIHKHDPVDHPKHYTSHPSGVECIQVTEHLNFCVGNAIKYLWRAGEKGNYIEDLKKAKWYIEREIERVSK